MSEADRTKWDQRYKVGAYRERTHATKLLSDFLVNLSVSNALDVACGAGRNSLFLAEQGMDVIGLDISYEALRRAEKSADHLPNVNFVVADLEFDIPVSGKFDLIVMIRYVNQPLLKNLVRLLNPGGTMVVEQHLNVDTENLTLVGPTNPKFRVTLGELSKTLDELTPLHVFEGFVRDNPGEVAAISQFVGKLPVGTGS